MALNPSSSNQDTTKMEVEGKTYYIPNAYICPITEQIMTDPLITKTGQHFERSAIVSWLQRYSGSCPLTHQPLRPSDMFPDRNLQFLISQWKEDNGFPTPQENQPDDDDDNCFIYFSVCDSSVNKGTLDLLRKDKERKAKQQHHRQHHHAAHLGRSNPLRWLKFTNPAC